MAPVTSSDANKIVVSHRIDMQLQGKNSDKIICRNNTPSEMIIYFCINIKY